MTFSIVARCPRTGQIGVAAATALQAVGKLACHAEPKVGAVASQALLNPYLAYDGLRLLKSGCSAEDTLQKVMALDPEANGRQVGVVDTEGRVAAWTGEENIPWAGDMQGRNFSTQGNRLAGPEVLQRVVEVMHETEHLDLSERLMLALVAADEKGGDTKGERSVNILVYGEEEYPWCDIRIDDHDRPMEELKRLFKLYQDEILPNMKQMPRRADMPRAI